MLWLVLSGLVSMSSAQAPTHPSVAGTRWQFPSSKGPVGVVVTFREDGVALFSGMNSTGHWKQSGDLVIFDVNAFTEYQMTMKGDEMTGAYIRLKGPDKGDTHPTSLKKL